VQDGCAGETENRQEKRSHQIGYQSHDACTDKRLCDFWIALSDVDESKGSGSSHDGSFSKHHHNPADHAGGSESTRVSDDQAEGVPCSFAEVGAVKSDLDISVLGDEFHILIEAPENASNNAL
jgi:hypothetical protein